ncbi:MAG: hypothetical protein GSR85_01575, partial [Desulfurococcales archaeon]|nr:hypothetical protein [Desulfurococcales archaeon]
MSWSRIFIVVECNTEETTAEKLLEGICINPKECIVHPRYGGIGRALKIFKEQIKHIESSNQSSLEVIGLIADHERGKIQEDKVNMIVKEVFGDLK